MADREPGEHLGMQLGECLGDGAAIDAQDRSDHLEPTLGQGNLRETDRRRITVADRAINRSTRDLDVG